MIDIGLHKYLALRSRLAVEIPRPQGPALHGLCLCTNDAGYPKQNESKSYKTHHRQNGMVAQHCQGVRDECHGRCKIPNSRLKIPHPNRGGQPGRSYGGRSRDVKGILFGDN